MDKIGIFDERTYIYPLKEHIGNIVIFSIHDESANMCCCGIWEWTILCYLIALEAVRAIE